MVRSQHGSGTTDSIRRHSSVTDRAPNIASILWQQQRLGTRRRTLGPASLSRSVSIVSSLSWGSRKASSRSNVTTVGLCARSLAWPAECPTGSATESDRQACLKNLWNAYHAGSKGQRGSHPPQTQGRPPIPRAPRLGQAGSGRGGNSDSAASWQGFCEAMNE